MKVILSILISFSLFAGHSQDTIRKWQFSGYLKEMAWSRFQDKFRKADVTNLVHNRLNLSWQPSNLINTRIEIRNRLYYGDDVRMIPFFSEGLRNKNEAIDLSRLWVHNKDLLLHTNIERLWLEMRGSKWNMRAGRQRINWGMANTWNPNDLFNVYNFLDFDYEERPGSDAMKIMYSISDLSNIEMAAAATNAAPIFAAKYATNSAGYDFQFIIGSYQSVFTSGIGWAGSIRDVGFKGEVEYYGQVSDSASRLNATVEADYMFKKGLYISTAFLYNQKGLEKPVTDAMQFDFRSSPGMLMPAKWNILVNTAKEVTPLLSISLDIVYSPGVHILILFPTIKYNIVQSLDADLTWQSVFVQQERFKALDHTGFLRFKWSF